MHESPVAKSEAVTWVLEDSPECLRMLLSSLRCLRKEAASSSVLFMEHWLRLRLRRNDMVCVFWTKTMLGNERR